MRIKTFATLGLAGGMLALAFGFSIPLANGAPANAPLLQPSPRPTLVPTSAPQPTSVSTSVPTSAATSVATAVPTSKPHATSTSKHDDKDDVVHYGRVTGTVIDQRTGAPVSHVKVMVGTYALMTDVSGNYDLWLPTGTYDVVLSLAGSQGTPVQATAKVTVKSDATVVQHLTLRSAAPAVVAPADAAPAVVAPADVSVSPALNTAPAAASVPAKDPAPAVKEQPTRLPTTGEGDTLPMMMVWLAVALVLMGSTLLIPSVRLALLPMLGMPQANKASDDRLLRRLIGADKKQTQKEDESFLNDLLR